MANADDLKFEGVSTNIDTARAVASVLIERNMQMLDGWTQEHDDVKGVDRLTLEASLRMQASAVARAVGNRVLQREKLVQAAALIVAAIEVIDRESLNAVTKALRSE